MPRTRSRRRRHNTSRIVQQSRTRSRSAVENVEVRSEPEDQVSRNPSPLPRLRSQARLRFISRESVEAGEQRRRQGASTSSSANVYLEDDGLSDSDMSPSLVPPFRGTGHYYLSDASDEEMFEGFGPDEDDDIGMDRFAEIIVYLESGDLLINTGHADDCLSDDGDLPDDPFQRELRGSMPEPTMSLHAAALRGNTKELRRWQTWRIGLCGKNLQEDGPMHCAARAGDVGALEQLIEQGASITTTNRYHHSPLEIAARYGHVEVVKTLLKHGAGVDPEEMDRAYEATKSWAVVEALRKFNPVKIKGVPQKQVLPVPYGPLELEKMAPWVNQMLFRVVQKGRVNMLKGLLDLGANVNCNGILGWTPLQIAVRRGHIRCVTALLEGGAKVDGRDDFKWTALHYAAREGHYDIALLLLKAGADVNAKCRTGRTPLAITTDEATRHLLENYGN